MRDNKDLPSTIERLESKKIAFPDITWSLVVGSSTIYVKIKEIYSLHIPKKSNGYCPWLPIVASCHINFFHHS